jgi:RNA polymerase sigma-70 factor, ECF subfamily
MAISSGNEVGLVAAGRGVLPVREESVSSASEDTLLVGAARDGDRTAFGHLYDRYAPMVHGLLLAKVPRDEVDDLVQDVFMVALRSLSRLRENGSFGAWLAAIARNRAIDYHRRSRPEKQLEDETDSQAAGAGGGGSDDVRQAQAILDAIRSLSEAYRETLILRLVEGMTGPEIAVRTGMTHGSVRVNLHRGMEQLRAKLSSHVDKPRQETG